MSKEISEIKGNYIIDGLTPLIDEISSKLKKISCDYAKNNYADYRMEQIKDNHHELLEESVFFDMEEKFPEIISKLRKLKSQPKPMFSEATFRCEKINTISIPDDMDFEILDTECWDTEYRFEINNGTIHWLAEMLDTEPFYLAKYNRIVTTR